MLCCDKRDGFVHPAGNRRFWKWPGRATRGNNSWEQTAANDGSISVMLFLCCMCCFVYRSWTCPLKLRDGGHRKQRSDTLFPLKRQSPESRLSLWNLVMQLYCAYKAPPLAFPSSWPRPAHPCVKHPSFPQTSASLWQAPCVRGFSCLFCREGLLSSAERVLACHLGCGGLSCLCLSDRP